jgi:hypothetical protein
MIRLLAGQSAQAHAADSAAIPKRMAAPRN